jgi:hypothetical protein
VIAPNWWLARIDGLMAPPLDRFYASLTDEQKARLNAATDQTESNRSLANCGA